MKDQFVTYEIAKRLKELGFNESCLGYFDKDSQEFIWSVGGTVNHEDGDELEYNCISAPLWQQAIDWLREKHNIEVIIQPVSCSCFTSINIYQIADGFKCIK